MTNSKNHVNIFLPILSFFLLKNNTLSFTRFVQLITESDETKKVLHFQNIAHTNKIEWLHI